MGHICVQTMPTLTCDEILSCRILVRIPSSRLSNGPGRNAESSKCCSYTMMQVSFVSDSTSRPTDNECSRLQHGVLVRVPTLALMIKYRRFLDGITGADRSGRNLGIRYRLSCHPDQLQSSICIQPHGRCRTVSCMNQTAIDSLSNEI